MTNRTPTFESTSAGGYVVRLDGREIGHVSKLGSKWHAKTVDFSVGEHPTRKAAADALADLDAQ